MASSNVLTDQVQVVKVEDATFQLEELTINATPAENIIGLNDPNIYKNSSTPRGVVFMANYKEFKGEKHKPRIGSEKDTENLKELFQMMGYDVPDPHINMSTKETREAIKNFQNNPKLEQADSCFVIIMSHGKDEKNFYTWDSSMDIMKDIVKKFTYKECPNLKGTPKVFIFQYCRGKGEDILKSQDQHGAQPQKDEGPEMDESNIGEGVVNVAAYTDMLLIYSTVEGYVSYRDEAQGSWLMHAICDIFMKNAHEKHIVDLMNMVTQKMLNEYSDSRLQVCQVVAQGFHRHLYLNPDPGMFLREKFKKMCESSTDEAYDTLCELSKKSKLFTVQEDSYARIEFGKENLPISSFWSLFRRGTGHETELIMKARESRELAPISTLRFEDVLKVVEPQYPEVYLELSYEGTELGRLQIQLDGVSYPRRVALFKDLCRPSDDYTLQNTTFDSLHKKGEAGEIVVCQHYMRPSSSPEWTGPPPGWGELEPAITSLSGGLIQGQLRGTPWEGNAGFTIVTRSDPTATGRDDDPVLGHVVGDGLELLQEAIATCAGTRNAQGYHDFRAVKISDCGPNT